ncbi:MAG: hypothetical protein LLG40_11300 [Deltaproteobacteria bacterium]|nr:hypothetical protein [Deltaproteobacteria bacterium]
MNVYRIRNITSNDWWEGKAKSAREACAAAGWAFDDCEIKVKSDSLGGGWCKCREK